MSTIYMVRTGGTQSTIVTANITQHYQYSLDGGMGDPAGLVSMGVALRGCESCGPDQEQ